MRRRVLVAIAMALAAPPAGALAATTIGSSLRQRANYFTRCLSDACTELQTQAGAARLAVREEGVITRWRVRAATLGGARLRVLHPAADGTLSVVATADWVALNRRHAAGADVLYQFPTRLKVLVGDVIALDRTRRAGGLFHTYGGDASRRAVQFDPVMAFDAAGAEPASTGIGRELLLNADVETDRDGDGFGDESQDNCPTIANDQTDNPCPRDERPDTTTAPGDDEATSTIIAAPRRFKRHRRRPPARALP